MNDSLKVECAWCKAHLSGPLDGVVSHGVCETCKAKMTKELHDYYRPDRETEVDAA